MSIFQQLRSYLPGSTERAVTPALEIDLASPQDEWLGDRCLILQVDGSPGRLASTKGDLLDRSTGGFSAILRDQHGKIIAWRAHAGYASSSNEAEYLALINGLRLVASTVAQRPLCVVCLSDSLVAVRQLSAGRPGKSRRLALLHAEALGLCQDLGSVRFIHIRRQLNRLADALAWEASRGAAELYYYLKGELR